MTIEQLKNVHQARPFQPFTLHMADCRSLHVGHPEFISHSPSGRTVIVYHEGDDFSIINLLLVNEVQVHGASSAGPNGEPAPVAR